MEETAPTSGTEYRHRLAAILAADAAGYSRLMAADERAALSALDTARTAFRNRIAANACRVVDTAGDSALGVFETVTSAVTAASTSNERSPKPVPTSPRRAVYASVSVSTSGT